MCNPNRSSVLIAILSLTTWLSLSTAFSTTSRAGLSGRAERTEGRSRRRRTNLFATETDDGEASSGVSSRRGFLNYVAAAAVCSTVAAPAASAMSRQSKDANRIRPSDEIPVGGAMSASSSPENSMPEPRQSVDADSGTRPLDNPGSQTLAAEYKPTAFQESISGFVSGSAVSTVKTLVKYPLDTATVRLQMPNTRFTIKNLPALFSGSFDGITAPLVSNIPGGAIFFAVKDATKSSLKEMGLGLPKWALTSLAVAAALPPYWAVRNPSEVVKTRLQVGADGYYEGMSTADAFKLALSNGGNSTMDGVSELYQGYGENVLYGFPADIIKFVAYDSLTGGRGKDGVSPAKGAMYGALSTAFAQLLTTPLDVLRNRIMAEVSEGSDSTKDDLSYVDRLAKIAREEGVGELFAGSSPRVAKAVLSGAIQFATYEETKQKMSQLFMRK